MVLTNTYQATIDGFMKHMNLSKEKSVELIKLGVKICKEAIELEQVKGMSIVYRLLDTHACTLIPTPSQSAVSSLLPALLSSPHLPPCFNKLIGLSIA